MPSKNDFINVTSVQNVAQNVAAYIASALQLNYCQHEQKEKSDTSKLTISTRAPSRSSNSFFSKTKFQTSKKYYSLFVDLFLLVESSSHRLYHDFGNNLYIMCDGEMETISYFGDRYR